MSITCGWETATSQIRVCIVLSAIYTTYLAIQAVQNESRKNTDTYLQTAAFLSFLLVTTGIFDILSVLDSMNDNFSMCGSSFTKSNNNVSSQLNGIQCSFSLFWSIGVLSLASGALFYFSAGVMHSFRKSIAIDSL